MLSEAKFCQGQKKNPEWLVEKRTYTQQVKSNEWVVIILFEAKMS
jgi:hypothetical protein